MFQEQCKVLENKKVAPGHFVLKMASPRIAKAARPGQFVQVGTVPLGRFSSKVQMPSLGGLSPQAYDPLLPRPFSFLTATKKDFSVLYHVVGRGTQILSEAKKGDALSVVGPLGNGFSVQKKPAVLVGGGVGIPPLYHLAQALRGENVHVFLGARNKSLLLCEKDFKKLGVILHVATNDGSKGHRGFVTEVVEEFVSSQGSVVSRSGGDTPSLMPDYRLLTTIYACGPTPMLKAVSAIARKYEWPCEVSVEVPMACGFGACLGCAIKVRENEGHRFAIACTEGPVFEGKEILWD